MGGCLKIVILGTGEMLSNLIEGTIDAGCEIAGVFRNPERKLFSNFFKSSPDLTLIKQYKLYEIKCKSANSEEFKKEILKLNADVVLVGSWGERLKKEIIDLPVIACVNVHPSFLPKYRGPNPYLQTILNRETSSGVTFHLMDKDFDSGAILMQKKIDILPDDTGKELKARTVFQARLMCAELLKKLEYGLIIPVKQNEEKASYFPNIKCEDMMLDFEKESAEQIHARIRAFHPWLPCYVTHKNKYLIPNPYKLKILNSKQTADIIYKNDLQNPAIGTVIDSKPESITVLCKDGKSLKMDDVKIYGLFNKLLFNQIFKIF